MELLGHGPAWAALETALASGRLHHAWLLVGPRGIGKRTFADQVAQRLLGGEGARALADAGAHPDLRLLLPDPDTPGNGIGIDAVRDLGPLLRSHAAMGGHRVVIVDAADDLNLNAANALLKGLEEPGAGLLFLLVAHAPGRLPATIRSRCRVLRFRPLDLGAIEAFLASRMPDLDATDRRRLATLAKGAPGEALRLAQAGAGALLRALEAEAPERLAGRLAERAQGDDYKLLCRLAPRLAAERARKAMTVQHAAAYSEIVSLARAAQRPGEDRAQMAHALALALKRHSGEVAA